jgi:ribonuclease E
MANKMLIDATHPEETRVVVLRGNRVEEFDFETAQRKQLRGNIYLAKVTRVEPSLQAAFVDYGGNRHGFLAFSEIHPDYYQIPVADRQALIDEEGRAQRAAEDEADRRSRRHRGRGRPIAARHDEDVVRSDLPPPADNDEHPASETQAEGASAPTPLESQLHAEPVPPVADEPSPSAPAAETEPEGKSPGTESPETAATAETAAADEGEHPIAEGSEPSSAGSNEANVVPEARAHADHAGNGEDDESGEAAEDVVESVGGADALEEVPDRAPRYRRQYKIQEVIKRRQVMLVQVVKEERGSKGAALTTYLSLAGRYSVLMPNTARGGGISRKITSGEDRSRLKEIAQELEVPEGMGVIVRTAGASRTKTEIKRDFEYLLRLWETVRDLTLKSTAPKLVYEEGSLVKRSIRDLYNKDIDEIIVAGTDAYREAKDFMRMLMPSHAKNVKPYADTQPLLSRYGVENQLDGMFSPTVQLRSGGYIVINQAEALVAIDVNSGRATREHHIEDTALKTNVEAADEIARQLRLRDLAGLIVIDFIDMDEKRNNRTVERRLKEALKHDRARIQVGRISHFGLLEMSRQRIRTSVLESSTEKCPYCGGSGHVRSVSSLALQVLRALEEQLMKGATHNLIARTRPDVALYVLNQKRAHLRGLEERFVITITISADETLVAPMAFAIDRGEQVHTIEAAKALAERSEARAAPLEEEDDLEEDAEIVDAEETEEADEGGEGERAEVGKQAEEGEHHEGGEHAEATVAGEPGEGGGPRRRRRRRRGRGRNGGGEPHAQPPRHAATAESGGEASTDGFGDMSADDLAEETGETVVTNRSEQPREGGRRRRRGRRGGRRNRQEREGAPGQEREGAPGYEPEGAQPYQHEAHQPRDAITTAEELTTIPATEPDLREAVADLDAGAPSSPAREAAEPPAPPEPPRRRSTVREPAPSASGPDTAAPVAAQPATPPPQPVLIEVGESEPADKPRRSGWWSRRFAGG